MNGNMTFNNGNKQKRFKRIFILNDDTKCLSRRPKLHIALELEEVSAVRFHLRLAVPCGLST